jgi:hypothetical protein
MTALNMDILIVLQHRTCFTAFSYSTFCLSNGRGYDGLSNWCHNRSYLNFAGHRNVLDMTSTA